MVVLCPTTLSSQEDALDRGVDNGFFATKDLTFTPLLFGDEPSQEKEYSACAVPLSMFTSDSSTLLAPGDNTIPDSSSLTSCLSLDQGDLHPSLGATFSSSPHSDIISAPPLSPNKSTHSYSTMPYDECGIDNYQGVSSSIKIMQPHRKPSQSESGPVILNHEEVEINDISGERLPSLEIPNSFPSNQNNPSTHSKDSANVNNLQHWKEGETNGGRRSRIEPTSQQHGSFKDPTSASKKKNQSRKKNTKSSVHKDTSDSSQSVVANRKKMPLSQTSALVTSKTPQYDFPKQRQRAQKKQIITLELSQMQVVLFSHLPQFERLNTSISEKIMLQKQNIPSGIVSLGLKFASHQIQGANARCLAMLSAFKTFVADYKQVTNQRFGMEIEKVLEPIIQFIRDCRPYSIGMGNSIRYIKRQIGNTMQMTAEESKQYIVAEIDNFIRHRVVGAEITLSEITSQRIHDGDVILTYTRSNAVLLSMKEAVRQGKKFSVIVVDSRPHYEGRRLVSELANLGLECKYVLLNAISYIMKNVTKVIIGVHAMMSNGQVYSRAGTAVVCMMAHVNHLPVLVPCETYKFCERIQLDSICQNELDDPENLNIVNTDTQKGENPLSGWRENPHLKLLNLVYDLTPTNFISMVITELGMIPPTSVPVVIREFYHVS